MAADIPENDAASPESAGNHPKKKHKEVTPPAPPTNNYGLERWKLVVEIATLLAVIYYACVAHGQLNGILESNKINRAIYEAADRPYVGPKAISVAYLPRNATSPAQASQVPTKQTESLSITAEIKNFGPVPGREFRCGWRAFLNGEALSISKVPDFPSTIFPSQSVYLFAGMGSNYYRDLQSGREVLTIDIWTDYVGPSGHYTECQKKRYAPDSHAFMDIGEKCTQ